MSDNMTKKRILNVKSPTIVDSYYEDEDFQKELDKVSDDILINAETNRTIKNIRKTLASALKKKYGFTNGELKELTSKILKIHGLEASNFDALSSFAKILESRVNDVSIDDNSNKNEKTIAGVNNEITASFRKLVGYHMLYGVMKDLFGQAEAKVLSGDLYDFSLGLSDSTNILIPYCWALDASKIVLEGRKFGQLPSAPVHRVDSYIAALDETIHQMSSHLAGAIAIGTFFLDTAHILIYKQRVPFEKIKTDATMRKYIENCFQTFVHSVNHLSRNGVESPFTNISLFDRVKLKGLVGPENYGWYFANKKEVALDNGLEDKMSAEQWQEFVINYIIELQEIYAKFHEKGDPLNNGIPYRFPVTTMNISKDDDDKVLDEKFFDFVCQRDITRFNIFTSKGTKVASCCLSATTKVLAKIDDDVKYLTVAQLYDIWEKSKDVKNIQIMGDKGFVNVTKGWKIKNTDNILNKITLKNGLVISTTLDHPSVKFDGDKLVEVKSEELKVGDIIPVSKNIQYECLNGGTFELGRYVGLFGAEGMFDRRGDNAIYFCFHTQEKEYQQFIKDFSLKTFGANSTIEVSSTYENSLRVRVMSRSAYGLIRDFFVGDLCTEKRLTSRIFNMSEDFRKGFLTGFIEGDGYTANSDRSDYGSIHINNKELAKDLVAIANSINIKCSLRNKGNSQVVNILHNDKMKLDVIKNWHDSKGSAQKSTVLLDMGEYYGVKIESIEQIKTKKNCSVYDFTVDSENHLFQIYNGIITHNCRLINDAELLDMGSSVNSFGGSTVSMGSHRVVTINFARIAYEANSMEDFYHILDKRIRGAAKVLKAHKVLIGKMEEKGLEPFITRGWIRMDRLFSTFGILGVVEAKKILETKFADQIEDGQDVMKDYLVYLNKHSQEYAKELGLFSNIEQIPGESYAVRLATVDNLIFDEDIIDAPLYANQFVPLWEDATIWEKLEADGKYNQLLTGGGIVHAQLGSKTTPSQNRKIIEYAIKCGCEHFVLNSVYSKCPKCGAVYDHKVVSCSKCGHNEHMEYYSRIVGYFTSVDSWNPTRKNWEFQRRTYIDDSLMN